MMMMMITIVSMSPEQNGTLGSPDQKKEKGKDKASRSQEIEDVKSNDVIARRHREKERDREHCAQNTKRRIYSHANTLPLSLCVLQIPFPPSLTLENKDKEGKRKGKGRKAKKENICNEIEKEEEAGIEVHTYIKYVHTLWTTGTLSPLPLSHKRTNTTYQTLKLKIMM